MPNLPLADESCQDDSEKGDEVNDPKLRMGKSGPSDYKVMSQVKSSAKMPLV